MAFSADEGKEFFKEWLRFFSIGNDAITSILDIGPGAGIYADLARKVNPAFRIDAIEIYEPYVHRFGLKRKYDSILVEDAVGVELDDYDLIILGDVFEHVDGVTAANWWRELKTKARFIWLSLPVERFREWFWGYNQTDVDWAENPAERHKANWKYDVLLDALGPFMWQVPFRTVVVLIAEGKVTPPPERTKKNTIDEQGMLKHVASAMFGPKGPEMLRTGPHAGLPEGKDLGIGWLLYAFVRAQQPEVVVEVGTGGSSHCLLQGIKDNGKGHLWTMDPFLTGDACTNHGTSDDWLYHPDETPYTLEHAHFIKTAERLGYQELYTLYHESSQDVGPRWDKPIDILMVDGDHNGKAVKADWDNFSKWIKPGGYALFHDFVACSHDIGIMLQEVVENSDEWSLMVEPNNLSLAILQRKFTFDSDMLWFCGRLTQPDNPQGARTPIQLTDAYGMPGLLRPWKGYYLEPLEAFMTHKEEAHKAAEELIASGKQQGFKAARDFAFRERKDGN